MKIEYEQHWEHRRHGIDKQYEAFNFYIISIALLVSAVSFAADDSLITSSWPVFLIVGFITFFLSFGVLLLLLSQRYGYVLHSHVIYSLRKRMSDKLVGMTPLQKEVDLFKGRPSLFELDSAAGYRYLSVILVGGLVIGLCTYLFGISLQLTAIYPLFWSSVSILISIILLYALLKWKSSSRGQSLETQLDNYD